MKLEYKRDLKKNYLIIIPQKDGEAGFEEKMLEEIHIPGLLDFEVRYEGAEKSYYYDISALQPLSRIREMKRINRSEISSIMLQLKNVTDELGKYMLSESMIALSPECVYIDPESFRLRLCAVPSGDFDVWKGIAELMDYLLIRVEDDINAVMLARKLFEISRRERFTMGEIIEAVEHDRRKLLSENIVEEADRDVFAGKENTGIDYAYDREKEIWEESPANETENKVRRFSEKEDTDYAKMGYGFEASKEREAGKEEEAYSAGERRFRIRRQSLEEKGGKVLMRREAEAPCKGDEACLKELKEIKKGFLKQILITMAIMTAAPIIIYILRGEEALIRFIPVLAVADIGILAYTAVCFVEKHNAMKRICEDQEPEGNFGDADAFRKTSSAKQDIFSQPEQPENEEPYMPRGGREIKERIEAERDFYDTEIFSSDKDAVAERRLIPALGKGKEIEIPYFPFTIGSREGINDYVMCGRNISPMHIKLDETDEGYSITDLNSQAGTSVCGRTLNANECSELKIGDEIVIGELSFSFV